MLINSITDNLLCLLANKFPMPGAQHPVLAVLVQATPIPTPAPALTPTAGPGALTTVSNLLQTVTRSFQTLFGEVDPTPLTPIEMIRGLTLGAVVFVMGLIIGKP